MQKAEMTSFCILHFAFCIRAEGAEVGTEGRARTADPQIHNLVL
jgi:hypothetical protein